MQLSSNVRPHKNYSLVSLHPLFNNLRRAVNYWAKDDPHFEDGHYVEDWELRHLTNVSAPIRLLLNSEAKAGNKIKVILEKYIELSSAPSSGVLNLPEGLVFVCPLRHEGTRVYEGEEDGLITNLDTNEIVYPSGHESPDPR